MKSSYTRIVSQIKAKPLPGYAFVRMKGVYDATSGLIAIPERFRTRRHGFGTLLLANPTPKDDRAISRSYADLDGNRVIFADYAKAPIHDDIYRIPLDSIIAVVMDDKIKIQEVAPFQGVERCQWCGPAKEGSPNSMMCDEEGYCYRCGKNAQGEKRDEFSDKSLRPFMNPK